MRGYGYTADGGSHGHHAHLMSLHGRAAVLSFIAAYDRFIGRNLAGVKDDFTMPADIDLHLFDRSK